MANDDGWHPTAIFRDANDITIDLASQHLGGGAYLCWQAALEAACWAVAASTGVTARTEPDGSSTMRWWLPGAAPYSPHTVPNPVITLPLPVTPSVGRR